MNKAHAIEDPEEYLKQFEEYKSYYASSVRWDEIKYFRIHKHKDKWTELFQHMKNQIDHDNQYNTVTAESMTNSLGPNFFSLANYKGSFDGNKLDFCTDILSPILNHITDEVPGHDLTIKRLEQRSRHWINENKETSHEYTHGNPSHPNSMTCKEIFNHKVNGQIDNNTGLPSGYIVHPGNWSQSNAFNGGGFWLNVPDPPPSEDLDYEYVHPGWPQDENKPPRYNGNELPQHLAGLNVCFNPLQRLLNGDHQQHNEPVKIQGQVPQSGGKRRKKRKSRRKSRRKRGKRKSKRGGEYSKFAKDAIKYNASKYPKRYASTKETYDPKTLLDKNRTPPSYPSKHPGKGGRRTKRRRTKRRRTRRRK